MKRSFPFAVLALVAAVLIPALHADVKTKERTLLKFEGMLGGIMNRFGGAATNEGVISTVAVKGNRLARINDTTGQIIDLTEQKIYQLDVKKKEYKVVTFAEMRQQLKDAQEKMAQQKKEMSAKDKEDLDNASKQLEFEADVKETGQKKSIAGYDTHEVILTITAHEKGKKIEESGGFIMASDMWLAPKVAGLDEITAFEMKFVQAVYGQALGIDPQQMGQMVAMYPMFAKMATEMQAQKGKLQGTPLTTTMSFQVMKSAEAMSQASSQSSSSSGSSGSSSSGSSSGGGLGGMLARKLGPRSSGSSNPNDPKTTIMTSTTERLSIEASASADDVAIPAGFKEKK
jgi:hypothetical protein